MRLRLNLKHALPLGLGLLLLAFLAYNLGLVCLPLKSDPQAVRVSVGDGAGKIARELKAQGVIRSEFWFRTLASLRGSDRLLKAGTYSLGGNHNLYQTLRLLEKGNTEGIRVTVAEGLSLYKTIKLIAARGLASYQELSSAAADTAFVRQLTGMDVPSLEGFLYPETYFFDLQVTPREILSRMAGEFFEQLEQAGLQPDTIPDFYHKLTLAAIVEKESGAPDERELVASVMYNRLRRGMNLASCPTVDYILERQGVKKPVLSLADTRIRDPYNTYLNQGLPPGPICNPSIGSLQAALHPAQTDYLYFVANRKGRNDFSRTAEEHLAKARAYKRMDWE